MRDMVCKGVPDVAHDRVGDVRRGNARVVAPDLGKVLSPWRGITPISRSERVRLPAKSWRAVGNLRLMVRSDARALLRVRWDWRGAFVSRKTLSWPGVAVRRTATLPLVHVPAIPLRLPCLPRRDHRASRFARPGDDGRACGRGPCPGRSASGVGWAKAPQKHRHLHGAETRCPRGRRQPSTAWATRSSSTAQETRM
jgi:hypothetical protein